MFGCHCWTSYLQHYVTMQLQFPDCIKVADGISADCGSNSHPMLVPYMRQLAVLAQAQRLQTNTHSIRVDASREVLYQDDRRSFD